MRVATTDTLARQIPAPTQSLSGWRKAVHKVHAGDEEMGTLGSGTVYAPALSPMALFRRTPLLALTTIPSCLAARYRASTRPKGTTLASMRFAPTGSTGVFPRRLASTSLLATGLSSMCLLSMGLMSTAAQAQVSVTVLENQTRRQDANGNTPSRTYTAPNQFAITRADCLDDQRFQISLNFNGSPSSTATTLQAWVSQGADCKEVAQRQGSTQQCWPANLGEDPGVNLNKTVTLKVRDILSQLNVTGGFSPTFQAGSEDTCKRVTTPAGERGSPSTSC